MTSRNYGNLLNRYLERYGEQQLETLLEDQLSTRRESLTLICNQSLHSIPDRYLHGDVFIASEGMLDFSSKNAVKNEYTKILSSVYKKLVEKEWRTIYMVPTGHSTLVAQIKLLVYQVLRINTIDLFYNEGEFFELDMNFKKLLT